jgi:hypothetical protein
MRNASFVAAIAPIWCHPAAAQSVENGQSICYEVQNAVKRLVDYTQTSCLPSGGQVGTLSLVVISSHPVFSVDASKKGWLLVAVASIGQSLNEQPSVNVDELWLSDANQLKSRVAFVLPASLATSLHRQVYNGQVDLERMSAAIKKNLVRKTIGE